MDARRPDAAKPGGLARRATTQTAHRSAEQGPPQGGRGAPAFRWGSDPGGGRCGRRPLASGLGSHPHRADGAPAPPRRPPRLRGCDRGGVQGLAHYRGPRRSLQGLALGKSARAECYEIDRFGRLVCRVFVAGRNVNLEQIERGWGMLRERADRVRDPASSGAEARARARKVGVWSLTKPLHPGVWRERCWGHGECAGAQSGDDA